MENNSQSPENDYVLAAVSYLPFISLFTLFTVGRRNYYIKYHAAHAALLYLFNLLFLILLVAIYSFLSYLSSFFINLMFGAFISFQLIASFSYFLYYAANAYQGRYVIIPVVTKVFYAVFK